jgi:hypothetical protein
LFPINELKAGGVNDAQHGNIMFMISILLVQTSCNILCTPESIKSKWIISAVHIPILDCFFEELDKQQPTINICESSPDSLLDYELLF